MKTNREFEEERRLLKSPINTPADLMDSDEDRKIAAPPIQKEHPEGAKLIDLANIEALSIGKMPFVDVAKKP